MCHYLFFRLLQQSVPHKSLEITKQTHALILTLNSFNSSNPILISKLISSYSHLRLPSISRQIFDSIVPENAQNVLLWNSLLSSYCNNQIFHETVSLFHQMKAAHVLLDNYSLAIVSKALVEIGQFDMAFPVHCIVIKHGFCLDVVLCNSVLRMYLKSENFNHAHKLFDEMNVRTVASWNLIIIEYARKNRNVNEVWKLLYSMQVERIKLDAITICSILPLCSHLLCGKEIHGYIIRQNLAMDYDFHIGNCLINMYSKWKSTGIARRIFDQIVHKNVFVWTSMINGYVENEMFSESLYLLRTMQMKDKILPTNVSLVSVLPAIGNLARLMEGKQVHAFAYRMELNHETSLNNALVDMYSKCGRLDYAKCIFEDKYWQKDAISWASMISSYGLHGKGEEAITLFNELCDSGLPIDHISIVGVLSACARSGLVSKGLDIYNTLMHHGVVPTVEICSCMVDMLGRANRLNEALNFIYNMQSKATSSVWGALYSSSLIHNNQRIQKLAYSSLLQLEPGNSSNYVSLSNLHASSRRWGDVAEVRRKMKGMGMSKTPGCSWINVNGVDSMFYSSFVAEKSQICLDIIYEAVDHLHLAMKSVGYISNYGQS